MKTIKLLMVALLLAVSNVASAQSREDCKEILEKFCEEYYESCFSERVYIKGSLTVTKEPKVSRLTGICSVEGTHSYKGQVLLFGRRKTHTGVAFRARIKRVGNTAYKVEFEKFYESDPLQHNEHWEKCTQTVEIDDDF